jgi:hypothetical protein
MSDIEHKPPVLKESEMAISLSGEYIGECLNPSYGEQPELLEYDPKEGGIICGTGKWAELEVSTVVALPHHTGHVSLHEFCGDKPTTMSDRQFAVRMGELYRMVDHRVATLCNMANELCDKRIESYEALDRAIQRAHEEDRYYHPGAVLKHALDVANDHLERHTDSKPLEPITRTGFLTPEPKAERDAVVHVYYLHHRLFCERHDLPVDEFESTKESAEHFPLLTTLLSEFEERPDARFGDTLLSACSEIAREMEEE